MCISHWSFFFFFFFSRPHCFVHSLHLHLYSSYCRIDKISQSYSESATGNWFGNRQLNRQLERKCPSISLNHGYWPLIFFLGPNAISIAFTYTYFQLTFVQTNVLPLSPNRQLNRQLIRNGHRNPQSLVLSTGLLFKTPKLCSQLSFILMFYLLSLRQTFSITFWIGNRQLNRQLVGTRTGHLSQSI